MAHVRAMQQDAFEIVELARAWSGGGVEVRIGCVDALTRLAGDPRDLAAAPAGPARAGFLARRALARQALARRLGRAPDEIAIAADAQGAPVVAAPATGLHLSLSGRGGLAAAAVADQRVGVDVEPIGAPFEPPLNVLHPAERAALAGAGDAAHALFLRIWTAKEAYLKALRTGLLREPSGIEVRFAEGSDDFRIFDPRAPARLATAFSAWRDACGQPLVLACVVLSP